MSESTFNDPQLWLNSLTGTHPQNHIESEADKRKWGALNDIPQPFIKHFKNGGDNDVLEQLGKQSNEASDIDLSPSELRQKRKEQNRVAQRAFRERKERHVKELEDKVAELERSRIDETKHLQEENQALRLKVQQMEAEIYTLKGAEQAFKLSIQKLREAGVQLPPDTTAPLATPPISELSPSTVSTTSNNHYHHHQQQHRHTSPSMTSSPYSASGTFSMTSSPPTAVDNSNDRFLEDHLDYGRSSISPPKNGEHHYHHHPDPVEQHSPSISNIMPSTNDNFTPEADGVGFAASETDRFDHQPDPAVLQGAKTIPYSQIWEKVQDHPKYDMFDIDLLCEDLKKKARCSGSGAVILEEDFYSVLEKYDI
ncbi:hypothetical protein BCR42DRAFT_410869 [Absidia repens]|uniref:BZIP domain-containing protein n=1 Tax=Absidia repens TaxID=90262 RepID=A0A1X2IL33_9FUNG|nr:hypothetical protein BCR42DRAFT_410869 [Absidia repens]